MTEIRDRLLRAAMLYGALLCFCVSASAQWFGYPTAGIPRHPDGKPHLEAPTPKRPDGKPDLTGLWQPQGGFVFDIARELGADNVPFQPWAKELYDQRRATESKDDPVGYCILPGVPRADAVPYPFKILETPGMTVILYEAVHGWRQIFTDGRPFPKDPNPTWMGYSIARWDGDVFVVETTGFNDKGWLDNAGRPATEALHVTERFRRPNFGSLEIEVTIDDPKAYTEPWTVTLPYVFLPDTELLEYVCTENNKDIEHLVGK